MNRSPTEKKASCYGDRLDISVSAHDRAISVPTRVIGRGLRLELSVLLVHRVQQSLASLHQPHKHWQPSNNKHMTDGSESFGQSFRNSTFGYALIVAKRSRGQEVIPWVIYLQRRLDLKSVWRSWRLNRVYLTFYLEVSFPHQGFCSSSESLWSVAGVALWTSYHRVQNMVRWLKEREQEREKKRKTRNNFFLSKSILY